jgi:hypothetical protein
VSRLVTFLSDYGYADEFVGVCHGVIVRRCPDVRIIDITHGVARHDIRGGALALRAALPYVSPGVHLAVVDPGVGGARRAIALQTASDERLLVGPDNGLLLPAAGEFGGVGEAVDISDSRARLMPTSATFHGRDIFAPVAAALADGAALHELGTSIDPESLTPLELPQPRLDGDVLWAHVLMIDAYGNISLDVSAELAASFAAQASSELVVETSGRRTPARLASTFDEVPAGHLLAYGDARGALALAVNRGSAAHELGLSVDDELRLHVQ